MSFEEEIAMFQSETYFIFEKEKCLKIKYSTEKAIECGKISDIFLEKLVENYNKNIIFDELLLDENIVKEYFLEKRDRKRNQSIGNVNNIYIFKVKDYITILVGRFDNQNDCYYVQRGDGKRFDYQTYRVEWSKKLNLEKEE